MQANLGSEIASPAVLSPGRSPDGTQGSRKTPPRDPPAGGAVQSMFGPPLRGRISGLQSAHGECPRILLQARTPSNKEPRFVVRPPALLAGFEKVALLGGQNVPLGFGRTGSAEIVQRYALD